MVEANAIEEGPKSEHEQPCFIPDEWVFDGNLPTWICRSKAPELPAATAESWCVGSWLAGRKLPLAGQLRPVEILAGPAS